MAIPGDVRYHLRVHHEEAAGMSSQSAKIAILGANGRMGRMLLREVLSRPGCTLAAAAEHAGSAALGQDTGILAGLPPSGIAVTADTDAVFAAADAVIDFTTAAALEEHAALAHRHGTALVVGTTGLGAGGTAALAAAAKAAPVLHAANMSLGVTLLAALVEQAAARLGPQDFDIEIFEAHHRRKTDAPSGTALLLGNAAAKGRGVRLDDAMIPSRFGDTGPRIEGSIGMQVFRGGDVIGDHTVTFAGDGERIELTHKASDRALFVRGALRAALWLKGRAPGLYALRDVLGLGMLALAVLLCAAPEAGAQMTHYTAGEKQEAPAEARSGSFSVTPVQDCYAKLKPGEANEIRARFSNPWQECLTRLKDRAEAEEAEKKKAAVPEAEKKEEKADEKKKD